MWYPHPGQNPAVPVLYPNPAVRFPQKQNPPPHRCSLHPECSVPALRHHSAPRYSDPRFHPCRNRCSSLLPAALPVPSARSGYPARLPSRSPWHRRCIHPRRRHLPVFPLQLPPFPRPKPLLPVLPPVRSLPELLLLLLSVPSVLLPPLRRSSASAASPASSEGLRFHHPPLPSRRCLVLPEPRSPQRSPGFLLPGSSLPQRRQARNPHHRHPNHPVPRLLPREKLFSLERNPNIRQIRHRHLPRRTLLLPVLPESRRRRTDRFPLRHSLPRIHRPVRPDSAPRHPPRRRNHRRNLFPPASLPLPVPAPAHLHLPGGSAGCCHIHLPPTVYPRW